ncbi:NUDIX hydrolase [Halosaccharopolyspora lacisalsi]|uniref:NUDIX hydrolase n=1 Tax=Halosaccharopolyspora lacisalsi TaxID=1000566 RepID=UPI002E2B2D73|nr:NUDIX domain-containing protein [Halosaccharopolyspora lacisalsi]
MIISEPPAIRCVGAVVHDRTGRLLMIRRANDPGRGEWSLPGGRVERGESDDSALRREVHEETGLRVTVGPLVGNLRRTGPHGDYDIRDYWCVPDSGTLCAGDDAADARWIDRATLTTLDRDAALTEGLVELLRSWDCLPGAQ